MLGPSSCGRDSCSISLAGFPHLLIADRTRCYEIRTAVLREGWNPSNPHRQEWCFIRARLAYHVGIERLRDALELPDQLEHDQVEIISPNTNGVVAYTKVDPREEMQFGFLVGILMLSEVPLTPFEAAMFYTQTRLLDQLRTCPNPTCPTRFFFTTKKGQKFCSTVCAEPAQRESKRRWWTEKRSINKKKS